MKIPAKLPLLALFALAPAAAGQISADGWHAAGQTWVVWDETTPVPNTYEVYASEVDFTLSGTTAVGERVGRLLPEDWRGARLKVASAGTT